MLTKIQTLNPDMSAENQTDTLPNEPNMSDPGETSPGSEQPFVSHLIELRKRLLKSLSVILIIFSCLFYFANDIYSLIAAPLIEQLSSGSTMIATEVASPFLAPFKLTLFSAVFIAMPYLLAQIWGFIAPGLYQQEQRLARPLLISSILLFYGGTAFAYFVVFPLIFGFFTAVTPEGVAVMTDISSYLDFVLKIFFAFGLAFEVPVATVLLIWSGFTSVESLKRNRPYVIVAAFVLGMLLTPPDIISQVLLALPIWLLFEAGLFFSLRLPTRAEKINQNDQ
jgi:sec-independent protein translocase protein TatC